MDPSILIFDSAQAAAEACGDRTLEILDNAKRTRGIATLAVSGGSTPRKSSSAASKRPSCAVNGATISVSVVRS